MYHNEDEDINEDDDRDDDENTMTLILHGNNAKSAFLGSTADYWPTRGHLTWPAKFSTFSHLTLLRYLAVDQLHALEPSLPSTICATTMPLSASSVSLTYFNMAVDVQRPNNLIFSSLTPAAARRCAPVVRSEWPV